VPAQFLAPLQGLRLQFGGSEHRKHAARLVLIGNRRLDPQPLHQA
jgi:hypothetical protein